jgi:hypothetical protein
MGEYMNDFQREFSPRLGCTRRWEAFQVLARALLEKGGPVYIGETGTVRTLDNWVGDGQSTRIWDWIVSRVGGEAFSVDLDPNCTRLALSLCPRVAAFTDDSIRFLANNHSRLKTLDLLFLDSCDFHPRPHLSELHHVGELAAAYPYLASGCLIAVDDCHRPDLGKHTLIKVFFDRVQVMPVHSGYITIWKKP